MKYEIARELGLLERVREGGGLFMDLSTPYKLEHALSDHFIGDETPDIAYLW